MYGRVLQQFCQPTDPSLEVWPVDVHHCNVLTAHLATILKIRMVWQSPQ